MTQKITEVAVAVFIKPDGSFLLSSRPEGKPYPGYWEFPGGKIETGETVLQALKRELMEELNVAITKAAPWFSFMMHYTHATVHLHCWRVCEWQGDMRGLEGQKFEWQRLDAITVAPTLPGCAPILKALALPHVYAITNASEMGTKAYLRQLEKAFEEGLKLVQVREKNLPKNLLETFAAEVVTRARAHDAKVLINADIDLARKVGADGLHLTSLQLHECVSRSDIGLIAASAHCREDIERAAKLKLDFVVLGTVKPTLTHPGEAGIGWEKFLRIAEAAPLPVYALGGLTKSDLIEAMTHGAHGIAMQRGLVS